MRPRQARLAEEFAAALDGSRGTAVLRDPALAPLVRLARGLEALPLGPTPDFRASLRNRLAAVAAVADTVAASPEPVGWERARTWVDGWRVQRSLAGAAATMTAVVLVAGVGTASSRALPGDAFYGVKRTAESVQVAVARNDVNRGKRHLQHAETRLDEIQDLVGHDVALAPLAPGSGNTTLALALGATTSDRVVAALRAMDEATRDGTELLTSAYAREQRTEPIDTLARFAARQRGKLWSVLPELPAEARPQAQASFELVTAVEEEAGDLLVAACGDECAPATDQPSALPPAVEEPAPAMTPTPTPEPQASPTAQPEPDAGDEPESPPVEPSPSDPASEPAPEPSPEPSDSPEPSPAPTPSPSPSRTVLPSAVPSPVREPVEEVVDEVGRVVPTPTPLP